MYQLCTMLDFIVHHCYSEISTSTSVRTSYLLSASEEAKIAKFTYADVKKVAI